MKNESISALTLYSQLLQECHAMTEYALTSGMAVPQELVQMVYDYTSRHDFSITMPDDGQGTNEQEDSKHKSRPRITSASAGLDDLDLKPLVAAHGELSELVKPATPRALASLAAEAAKGGWGSFLSPVLVVRRLLLASLFFLVLFIVVSLSTHTDGEATLQNSGLSLLLNELLFLSAAGLGATFAILFQINSSIIDGTYDPRLESSYWIKIVLGLVAGLLLAVLIPVPDGGPGMANLLAEPVIALLGGFSSELMLHIINRLIKSLESLILGTREQ